MSLSRVCVPAAIPAPAASIFPLQKIRSDFILPLWTMSAAAAENVWRRVFMTRTETMMNELV